MASDIETFHCPTSSRTYKTKLCNDNNNQQRDSVENAVKKRKYTSIIDGDLLTDKEQCLSFLTNTFPHVDIMKMQDILVSCEWDIEEAIRVLLKHPFTNDYLKKEIQRKLDLSLKKGYCKRNKISTGKDELNTDTDNRWLNKDIIGHVKTYAKLSSASKPKHITTLDKSNSEILLNDMQQNCHKYGENHVYQSTVSKDANHYDNKIVDENCKMSRNYTTQPNKRILSLKDSSDEDGSSKFKPQCSIKVHKNKKHKKVANVNNNKINEYHIDNVCDSDGSSEDNSLNSTRVTVLTFFQEAAAEELTSIPGCSKEMVDTIQLCRPFSGWADLVQKFEASKYLTTDLLESANIILNAKESIVKLRHSCEQRKSADSGKLIDHLMEGKGDVEEYVNQQPSLLNNRLNLAPYQLLGLNWLVLMHKKKVNGVLADEMGVGKTIQAIAFVAHLKEQGEEGPFLIVVPSSTVDNWQKELLHWFPSANVLYYHGSRKDRKMLRSQILNDEVEDFDILVTTYTMVSGSAEDRSLFKNLNFHYIIFDTHMLKNTKSQRYRHLNKIKAKRRLLLTETPLQNNMSELMSLLRFVMPDMFAKKIESVRHMFLTHFLEEIESVAEHVQSTSDYTNKLQHFQMQEDSTNSSNFQNSILNVQIENRCPSTLLAGKDKGIYLVPDLPDRYAEDPNSSLDGIVDDEEKNDHYAEVPESFLQVIFTDESQSVKTTSTDPNSQPNAVSVNEIKKEIDSDSDKYFQPIKRENHESDYCDVTEEQKHNLELMMKTFPHSDITVMHDILLFAEWNVEQAVAFLNEHSSYERKCERIAAQAYIKTYKDATESIQDPVLESKEIGTDDWQVIPTTVTLEKSKNIAESKTLFPNTNPVIYGSKERARVKRQVKAFLRRQQFKEFSDSGENQFEMNHETDQLEGKIKSETIEPIENSTYANQCEVKIESEATEVVEYSAEANQLEVKIEPEVTEAVEDSIEIKTEY